MSSAREVYERTITGRNLVAGEERSQGATWSGISPGTGEPLPVAFHEATRDEVADAVRAAADALVERWVPAQEVLSALCEAAADELEAASGDLLALVDHETALGTARAQRELDRTVAQFRFFAREAADGSHVEATLTRPDPDAPGVPRPDLRRMLVPVGPVGVFGASNFPLAFSVPGGDTASALAAGCPVVVKAHPAHPGTSERCARALGAAVAAVGLPPGWFSMVQGRGTEVGEWLVTAPELAAVGFTGSLAGGRALHDLAAARPAPVPVYAEMGSLNPMFVSSAALEARPEQIAEAFVATVVTNAGQLCTKPGLVFVPDSVGAEAFAAAVAAGVADSDTGPLLSAAVHERLERRLQESEALPGVSVAARSERVGHGRWTVPATVLRCDLDAFLEHPALSEEHFGPVAVMVSCPDEHDLVEVAGRLEGSLTATVHAEVGDEGFVAALGAVAARNAGRIVYNGVPTGLAVAHATHHGGPYPATTSALHTSVGSTAVRRFLRPVAYQAMPDHLVPPALQAANPLGLTRNIDGEWTRAPLGKSP